MMKSKFLKINYPKQKKNKFKHSKSIPDKKYQSHPLYGDIPLIKKNIINNDDKTITYWDYDVNFEPQLPPGSIRGDVSKQLFCSMCHTPKYFYIDIQKNCIQCGNSFIFSAKEQKFWYEKLKFNFHSEAIRCKICRKQRQTDKAIKMQLDYAHQKAKKYENDPIALLSLVEAIIKYYNKFGHGNLNEAISICRKAFKLSPFLYECLYFEAVLHELLERNDKAISVYREFIDKAINNKKKYRNYIRKVHEILKYRPSNKFNCFVNRYKKTSFNEHSFKNKKLLIDKSFLDAFIPEKYSTENIKNGIWAKFYDDGQLQYFRLYENGSYEEYWALHLWQNVPKAKLILHKSNFILSETIEYKNDRPIYTGLRENAKIDESPIIFDEWVKNIILDFYDELALIRKYNAKFMVSLSDVKVIEKNIKLLIKNADYLQVLDLFIPSKKKYFFKPLENNISIYRKMVTFNYHDDYSIKLIVDKKNDKIFDVELYGTGWSLETKSVLASKFPKYIEYIKK